MGGHTKMPNSVFIASSSHFILIFGQNLRFPSWGGEVGGRSGAQGGYTMYAMYTMYAAHAQANFHKD